MDFYKKESARFKKLDVDDFFDLTPKKLIDGEFLVKFENESFASNAIYDDHISKKPHLKLMCDFVQRIYDSIDKECWLDQDVAKEINDVFGECEIVETHYKMPISWYYKKPISEMFKLLKINIDNTNRLG